MILLSNTKKTIVGLDGYGLTVVGQPSRPDYRLTFGEERVMPHILIVEAPYYRNIAEELRAGRSRGAGRGGRYL